MKNSTFVSKSRKLLIPYARDPHPSKSALLKLVEDHAKAAKDLQIAADTLNFEVNAVFAAERVNLQLWLTNAEDQRKLCALLLAAYRGYTALIQDFRDGKLTFNEFYDAVEANRKADDVRKAVVSPQTAVKSAPKSKSPRRLSSGKSVPEIQKLLKAGKPPKYVTLRVFSAEEECFSVGTESPFIKVYRYGHPIGNICFDRLNPQKYCCRVCGVLFPTLYAAVAYVIKEHLQFN